ncbi:ribosomal RNA processing protein 1 homolog B isoform X2 [Triplophysa dalaica]|uniref:ribosomal RNA processing protein 1 homolog B isoform X2 n=1 Tax=Triplophysa dalaica TaxID=1582913 RepID=UPI0024DF8AB9|nr:ribosomal RNA processing protein 1 homolog B isoform X2 [Triplophysa dalaica]
MASQQEAEIIFAQKLASNEKPIRSKAILKLRKYISVRSERETGGFTEVELLKIWKGLFYCQWMQDMPVLQEELSTKISGLLHSFRTVDSQLLYFKTFLQTMKREWNGIDRLRMDKFYQMVRFVFREMFKLLRQHDWKSSLVNEFLELMSEQLLQSSSSAPPGLILHILDLYMTELAVVGSDMLTAQQNLTFIEPFCKTLAKTKDRVMLKAIGSNIFNSIVDQVPYAIEDLLREIEESGPDPMNHTDDDDQEEDSGLVEDDLSDVKGVKDHDECGPVLQFDYGAVADRLFQLASLTYIPSFNRSKIYKFVKIFRDLAEGVFPQDEMEEVSTDDEDEDDDRRKKKKRKRKRSKKQSQEKTDKDGENRSETIPEDPSQEPKQEKKRKKKGVKSVEDKTRSDADRPTAATTQENNAEGLKVKENLVPYNDSSDLRPDEKESESGADVETNISVLPSALQKKKKLRKLKKTTTRDVHDDEQTDENQTAHINSAPEHTSREEEPSSDPSTITTPLKKRKVKKMKTRDAHDGEKTDHLKEENYSGESNVTSARDEEQSSDPSTPKKRKTKKTSSDQTENNMTARKSERVRAVKSEAEESHEHTNTSQKKKKMTTLKSLELNGDTTEPKRRKKIMMNGHTESVKKPKTLSKPVKQTDGFVFSEKKSPTALFCRSTRMSRRRQSCTTPKSETKKVTFGLKNNQTMEFRKMDRSALVSPGGPSRVAFDPKKTPVSGVLKSPTSSPALRRRFNAADFF